MLRDHGAGRIRPGNHVTFVTEATATSPIAQHDASAGQTAGQLLADPRTPPASMPGEMAREPLTPQETQVARLAREDYPTRKSPRACSSPRIPSSTT